MNPITTIRWIVVTTALGLSALATSASAQQPIAGTSAPPPPAPPAVSAPAVTAPAPTPGVVTPLTVAAPPPDPKPANWGEYTQPVRPPVAPLVLEYSLAAPPTGIFQPDAPQQYRAPVVDSENIWRRDALLNQAIDLWRPDGLAPIGVTQDATLRQGQFLFSYRFNYQYFDDNFVGSHKVSDAAVGAAYPFTPTHMETNRNLLIMQYGVTDDFTIFGQLPFQHSALDYTQTGGADYRTGFTEPADVTISGMYVLWRRPGQQIHMNFGMDFLVGFLDSQSDIPSPVLPNLPYMIRTGSGTFDLLPGLTYRGQTERWTWGVQSIGTVRLGINREDYKLGDRADLTAWLARRWGEGASTSIRLDNQWWGNVRGADARLNPALSPTNDPSLQGGSRIDLLLGLNLFFPNTRLPGQRLSIEAGAPLYQSLNGPQLGTSWILTTGWNLVY